MAHEESSVNELPNLYNCERSEAMTTMGKLLPKKEQEQISNSDKELK